MNEMNQTVFVNTDIDSSPAVGDDDLNRLYMELGKAYYEGAFEDPLPQLLPLFDQITKITKQEEAKALEPGLQIGNKCKGCGAELSDQAIFCAACGMPVDGKPEERVCMKCGTPLSEDALFCGICGTPAEVFKAEEARR